MFLVRKACLGILGKTEENKTQASCFPGSTALISWLGFVLKVDRLQMDSFYEARPLWTQSESCSLSPTVSASCLWTLAACPPPPPVQALLTPFPWAACGVGQLGTCCAEEEGRLCLRRSSSSPWATCGGQAVGTRRTSKGRVDAQSWVVVAGSPWGAGCKPCTPLTLGGAPPSSHGAGVPLGSGHFLVHAVSQIGAQRASVTCLWGKWMNSWGEEGSWEPTAG